MKKYIFIIGMIVFSGVFADTADRTLTDEEIMACKELGDTAAAIQDVRNNTKVEVWDFYHKNKDLVKNYSPDETWYLIRKVYSVVPIGVHPAKVSFNLFSHCTKYTYESKPELAYNI